MIRKLWAIAGLLLLSACGGGGGGGGGSSASSTPVVLTNFATVTVDAGPAVLNTGANAYTANNLAFVSVTLCAPGGATCQTIDHVIVDTGSIGLRVFQSTLSASLLAALPNQTDTSGNPVGECYAYVDGYVFGSVRQADFQIGGETVANMPFQLVADTGAFSTVPSSCSSGGGSNMNTVQAFGANGIIGIGVATTDCGVHCQSAGGSAAAAYYDCPASGCASIITRTAATKAPFQQLPNPVAAMSVDNNGTLLSLPVAPAAGEASMTGTLYFGIGTQTNNSLGTATILATTNSSSAYGSGLVTAFYNSSTLDESFIDSGSNAYFFIDSSIAMCSSSGYTDYYCPVSPTALTPTLKTSSGGTASAAFTLYNAQSLLSTGNAVAPGIGVNQNTLSSFGNYSSTFDFGLPFFYGRTVYTALEGRAAGGTTGPYVAF